MAVNQKEEFVLGAVGDAMVSRPILPYEGVNDRFDRLLRQLRAPDVTVVNLESVVHDYQHPPANTRGTIMRTPPEVLDDLAGMGIDMVSGANNHMTDYGFGGIESTIEALRARGIPFAGFGSNLFEARQPGYQETAAGRVSLISASTKIKGEGEATVQTPCLKGRPGINPLHVDKLYKLSNTDFDNMKTISEHTGIEDIKKEARERGDREVKMGNWDKEGYFHFEGLKFGRAESTDDSGIEYEVDGGDLQAICDWIEEANNSSDQVVVSIHSHEGIDGRSHTERPPRFLVETSHRFVDAGADAVIGTGTKVLRGMEIYNEKPIFYSLGNFIDHRTGMTRFPPEMYRRWDIDDYTKPSKLFEARYGSLEEPRDQLADRKMWESVIPVCTFNGSGSLRRCELYPITLQRSAPRSQRGNPVLATGKTAERILDRAASLSSRFGTKIAVSDGVGSVKIGRN